MCNLHLGQRLGFSARERHSMQIDKGHNEQKMNIQFSYGHFAQKGRRIGKRCSTQEQHSMNKKERLPGNLHAVQPQT